MQKCSSPARMRGRKSAFCSSVPNCMIVGPTVLIVSIGTGAPERIDSSKKMNCSICAAALAAVLLGPADAEPAVGGHLLDDLPVDGPAAHLLVQRVADLVGQQLVVVRTEFVAQLLLLFCVGDLHHAPRLDEPAKL